jgi:two-component system, OmpR family, sensor kinase
VPTVDDTLLLPPTEDDVAEERVLAAILVTAAARTHIEEARQQHEEHRHEARAALLGIEAAARALSRHRDLMTAEQLTELADGLVAEVYRLRALIDEQSDSPSTFDLGHAIAPVLTCMRVEGLVIRTDIADDLRVEGVPAKAAQAILALLTNAQRHAPGSPVNVRAVPVDDGVALCVEDRGPGVEEHLRERLFERGSATSHSDGAGLGLFIARRLMHEQNGTIFWKARHGGGSSFVLVFRAVSGR